MAMLMPCIRAAGLALLAASSLAAPQPFTDPVEQQAQMSPLAARSPVMALARAGARLVAAGVRGHILFSDDDGKTWHQAQVPVSSDLVGLSFPTPAQGWAVGHGGVVLHSADGGRTWHRQLATGRGEPFLDVYFWNEKSGFIAGTFGSLFRTDDGGRSWQPWMDRMDNPDGLNLFAVRGQGERVFIAGEQGKVWRLDPHSQRFAMLSTPYPGTLFGLLVGEPGRLLAYGMRGALLRSLDEGASWTAIKAGTTAGLTSAAEAPDGRLLLADSAGNLLVSRDGGHSFSRTAAQVPAPIFALSPGAPGRVVTGGPIGLLGQALP
ncbi:YCF48-related protein [Pelomonas sp. KK5]|uniref:WD40/YVTN/BNR-like repeat-containing protein n=1 Tax=Pelomonas sp. KK5 TaxID=1855730 RepID=UPI00097CB26E|nr:YCF48-related protein [Pelomonas sp. KK5]